MSDDEVVQAWTYWIDSFVIADIRKALDGNTLEVSLIILCLIGVESLSGYYQGRTANRDTFVAFLSKYFPEAYGKYGDIVYQSLRNGLLHDYVPKRVEGVDGHVFVMNRVKSEPHLQECVPGMEFPIWFNREMFARDFLSAWEQYKNDLKTDRQLVTNLLKRIGKRGFLVVGDLNNFLPAPTSAISTPNPPPMPGQTFNDESYSGGTIESRPTRSSNMTDGDA